jgi:hypothetical protein
MSFHYFFLLNVIKFCQSKEEIRSSSVEQSSMLKIVEVQSVAEPFLFKAAVDDRASTVFRMEPCKSK